METVAGILGTPITSPDETEIFVFAPTLPASQCGLGGRFALSG